MHHSVHLHMVGVSIAAVPVIADQHLRVFLVDDLSESTAGLVEIGPRKGSGVVVLRPAGHPRVVIAQPRHPADAEHSRRRLQLTTAPIRE